MELRAQYFSLTFDITGNLNLARLPLKYGTCGFADLKHGCLVKQTYWKSDCYSHNYLIVVFS